MRQFKKVQTFQRRLKKAGVFYSEYRDPAGFGVQVREHLLRVIINWHPDPHLLRKPLRRARRHYKPSVKRRLEALLTLYDSVALLAAIDRLKGNNKLISLVLVDIDRFKRFTTSHGKVSADQYLAIAVHRERIRTSHTLLRVILAMLKTYRLPQ